VLTGNFSVVDLYRMMRTKGFAEGLTQGLLDRSCMYGMRGSIPTQPAVTSEAEECWLALVALERKYRDAGTVDAFYLHGDAVCLDGIAGLWWASEGPQDVAAYGVEVLVGKV
jgi:hypothetical protein